MILIVNILIAIFLLIFFKWIQSDKTGRGPPGPRAFPIIGHLPLLGLKPHETLSKWSKIYGPIISVQFGSLPAVVLNDASLIKEAFSKPSFCGRPYIQMYHQVTAGKRGVIMNDGSVWSEQRRFVARTLNDCGLRTNEAKTQEEVNQLLDYLSSHAGKSIEMKDVFSTLWSIIMGQRFQPDDPELNRLFNNIHASTSNFGIMMGLATTIPWIGNLFPDFCGITKIVNALCQVRETISCHINIRNKTRIQGQPRDFTDFYSDKVDSTVDSQSSFSTSEQPIVTAELFAAGFEGTSVILEWLVLYMTLFPEIQVKMQAEIDKIVGPNRQPTLADRPSLVYVEAVILEVFRFGTTGPFGLFHSTMDNVNFHGYEIPKDTLIISNFHCINYNPELWTEPNVFQPERFIDSQGNLIKFDHFMPFSWGKRKCIGENLAMNTLFLFCAGLFQKFLISPTSVLPTLDSKLGFLLTPQPFQVILNERNPN